jgi:8-oxo-dGTP pyrophosphatase MutT (NUDIX family)
MSFRLAAYAVCIEDGRVLLAYHGPTDNWTLPGGKVEHGEDPFDAVGLRRHRHLEDWPPEMDDDE